jgi:transcriptional regulator with XRE-family HTH domain
VSYGRWLASELARRRISQRSLAVRAGIDHSTISRIVRAEVDPLVSTAARIAGVVGWPPHEVLIGMQPGGTTTGNAGIIPENALILAPSSGAAI